MNLVFETQNLRLKPALKSDLETLHRIFVNPYVRKYLCDGEIWSLQQVEEILIESQKLFEDQQFGLWLIETKAGQAVVGFVGLWYFFDQDQPQLAYALLPQATKKGYATEAAAQILDYALNELGYQYLVASADAPNLESHRVAARLGMRTVGERTMNGKPTVFFRIEKELA